MFKGGKVKKIINIWKAGLAWGKGLHREAALDSLRNVLAVVGAATILADFATIKVWLILPMLAIAGNLAKKKYVPPSLGTFPVTTPLFSVLLVGVIVIVGALTFFPALSLGPILEHLLMQAGKTF